MKLIPLVSLITITCMQSAFAAPEAVNCRDEISYKKIYQGPVQCDTNYIKNWCDPVNANEVKLTQTKVNETLYGNAEPTTRRTMNLYKMITYRERYRSPFPGA